MTTSAYPWLMLAGIGISIAFWVLLARRDTREKLGVPMAGLEDKVRELLDNIQQSLLARAIQFRDEHTHTADDYDSFKATMEGRPGFVISPWCGSRSPPGSR